MTVSKLAAAAAVLLSASAMSVPAMADPAGGGVKVGTLTCNVAGGAGFIFGSSKDLACTYSPYKGMEDHYYGSIDKFGVDIGYTEKSTIIWTVFAPTDNIADGALAGSYGGVSAGATVGVGLGANVLVGGFKDSIALQPVSVEGTAGGLNVAAGISSITLKAAPPA